MATNVFGNPVTDDTVRLIYPDITEITARHRAQVALLYKNADEKATNVSRFVHNLKSAYGTGTSTLCMVYNATGGNLSFVLNHTWEGNVWQSPYPQIIQNGQWSGFLHVRGRLMGPSKEAVVYRGHNNDGASRDWMLAWNTSRRNFQNRVYTETRTAGGFDSVDWNTINSAMERQGNSHSDTSIGCFSSVSVGAGSSPLFEGIMSLAGLSTINFMAIASSTDVDVGVEDDDDDHDESADHDDGEARATLAAC